MSDKSRQKQFTIACIAIAIMLISTFLWLRFTGKSTKEGFNQDNLKTLGFTPIYGSLTNREGVVTIDEAAKFVYCAKHWNVTTVFLDDSFKQAWFTHEGIIYLYEW